MSAKSKVLILSYNDEGNKGEISLSSDKTFNHPPLPFPHPPFSTKIPLINQLNVFNDK